MAVSHSRRRRGGFTLIEVLLVLVILVILASFAIGSYTGIRKEAHINAAKTQIGLFESPLELYELSVRSYPTTDQGLEALRTAPTDLADPDSWHGPYLKKPVPLDPWGNPYQYECPGRYNRDSFDLCSLGPDGKEGGDDDIGNWVEE